MEISGFLMYAMGLFMVPLIEPSLLYLPICDELVIAVGDSTDGTREAIAQISSNKIKIIDTMGYVFT